MLLVQYIFQMSLYYTMFFMYLPFMSTSYLLVHFFQIATLVSVSQTIPFAFKITTSQRWLRMVKGLYVYNFHPTKLQDSIPNASSASAFNKSSCKNDVSLPVKYTSCHVNNSFNNNAKIWPNRLGPCLLKNVYIHIK